MTVRELFGDRETLVVYHLMYHPDDEAACPMCSMWVDGFNGVAAHLAQHTAFAVIGKAPLPKLRSWARRRGWDEVRVLSSHGTSFNADMHAERPDGAQRPMISVLAREGGEVRHFYTLLGRLPRRRPARHRPALPGLERARPAARRPRRLVRRATRTRGATEPRPRGRSVYFS
ncbi:DUF899 family protein [Actinomadura luteofluorescens]|uniref:DUF899 family protein n=1 Tax=Actinomadura luteofluorescens TaxID=46163 RepID=UPI0036294FCE